jgi:hypothetical protein
MEAIRQRVVQINKDTKNLNLVSDKNQEGIQVSKTDQKLQMKVDISEMKEKHLTERNELLKR